MSDFPKKIWLNVGEEGTYQDAIKNSEVSWCENKIDDNDIPYVSFVECQQHLALKDLEIMRLREALLKIEFEYDYTLDKELTEAIVAGFELARATPTTYDDLMAWHDEQLGEPVAWISDDENFIEFRRDSLLELSYKENEIFPLYAKKG